MLFLNLMHSWNDEKRVAFLRRVIFVFVGLTMLLTAIDVLMLPTGSATDLNFVACNHDANSVLDAATVWLKLS